MLLCWTMEKARSSIPNKISAINNRCSTMMSGILRKAPTKVLINNLDTEYIIIMESSLPKRTQAANLDDAHRCGREQQ